MRFKVLFYKPGGKVTDQAFDKESSAKKWAALVRRNGYRVKKIEEVTA